MDFILRKATSEDCDLLYRWANDPVVRKAAFHSENIPYDTHVGWFGRMMEDENTYQFILCLNESLIPVAQIRFSVEGNSALISYSVSAEFRGQGVGTSMIKMAEEAMLSEGVGITTFVAQVKYDNPSSARIFEKCGYILTNKEEYLEFVKKTNRIIIRADGNESVGLGHIMRCLSIADAARAKGADIVFVIADDKPLKLIEERGYKAILLNTDYRDMDSELNIIESFSDCLGEKNNSVWLVDSYYVTKSYLNGLSQYGKVAVMDDLFSMDYPVDCVINYNIYGDIFKEKVTEYPNRLLLCGVKYAPLRDQFIKLRNRKSVGNTDVKKHILISTGGSDSLHLAEKISTELLNAIDEDDVILDIVCGSMNPNKEALLNIEKDNPERVKVHINVTEMAKLMAGCTFAVTAAGSTVYELSSLGVPFVIYYFVDNQKLIAEYSEKILGIINAGDFSVSNAPMSVIVNEVKHAIQDESYRQKISDSVYNVVDGNGAKRIAEKLMLSL